MEIALTTRLEPGYLHSTAKGRFSLEAAQKHFNALLDAIVMLGVNRVLVDGREVTGEPKMLERFLYGEFAATASARMLDNVVMRPPKMAYVLLEPVLDPGRLGETTARKRGLNVKAFDNLKDAVLWLLQPNA